LCSLLAAVKDLVFPPHCLGCERPLASSRPPLLCPDCLAELAWIRSPRCSCCGLPFDAGGDHLCGDCLAGNFAFDRARSLWRYQPPVSALILALKFKGQLTGIASLARLAAESESLDLGEPDLILPVPLWLDRLRGRGFNQALVLARGCFPAWRKRIRVQVLARTRATPPQSSLSGEQRRQNLRRAFSLADPSAVAGRRILLVDDVFTTGSTLNECSRILRGAGAARIEAFTLARSLDR